LSVCRSAQARFENSDDSWGINAEDMLSRWNGANQRIQSGIEAGFNISIVNYDRIFDSLDSVSRVYRNLGLSIEDADMRVVNRLIIKSSDLLRTKKPISESILVECSQRANFSAYRSLLDNHCILQAKPGEDKKKKNFDFGNSGKKGKSENRNPSSTLASQNQP
jgi:hypothetical protein